MNRLARISVLALVLLTWEPLGSLALGPLHLHEGETTPHRDHESEDQSVVVTAPATPLSNVSPLKTLLFEASVAPLDLTCFSDDLRLVSRVCALGSRSPPLRALDTCLPLLI